MLFADFQRTTPVFFKGSTTLPFLSTGVVRGLYVHIVHTRFRVNFAYRSCFYQSR
ncbi:hypothetical protein Plhal304r1_c033g0104101 [Plasmopara halstedii]